MVIKKWVIVLGVFYSNILYSFIPEVKNYSSKDYDGHQINYNAIFNDEGILYVANAYGMLEFNGSKWNKIPLPGGKSPVSLSKSDKGVIYIAGDNEFGYLSTNNKGVTKYISLINLLSIKQKEKIGWMIYCVAHHDKVYFLSLDALYVYDGETITVIPSAEKGKFLFLGVENKNLFVMEQGKGIGIIKDDLNISWLKGDLENLEIKGIDQVGENQYNLFGRHEVWFYDNGKLTNNKEFNHNKNNLYSDFTKSDEYKILSSEQNGVYILDKSLGLRYHYNKSKGELRSNYVYGVASNDKGDIALCTSNGISIIHLSASIFKLGSEKKVDGAGYSSLSVGEKLFLGTSQGLFFTDNRNSAEAYKKVNNVNGIVYDLLYHDNKVFFGDQSDFYNYENGQLQKISKESWRGSFCIKSVPNNPNIILVGAYETIDVYRKINGNWQFTNEIVGYNNPGRTIELDDKGNIWVASGLNGLYYLEVDENYSKVKNKINLSSQLEVENNYFIELVKVDGIIYVSSYDGIYSVKQGELIKDNAFISALKLERIKSINNKYLFTVNNHNPILFKKGDNNFVIDSSHVLNTVEVDMIGNSEMINEIESNTYLLGTSDGFVLAKNTPREFYGKVKVNEIKTVINDSLLPLKNLQLPYKFNNLIFLFSFSALENFYHVKWYTKLNDEPWKRVISKTNFKEFSNLKEGQYKLKFKAVSRYKIIGEKSIEFEILPPWYRSVFAKITYLVLAFGFIVLIIKYWKKREQKIQEKLEDEKLRELEHQKNYYTAELLKTELQKKETKMSYLSLAYTQKKDLINFLEEKLTKLIDLTEEPTQARKYILSIKNSLNIKSNSKEEVEWQEFKLQFDKTHRDFIEKLKKMDPKIKESFILMCVYIRMGKSNKEISNLLNLSNAALDKRKSRLKEKFNVSKDITLNEFLMQL